MLPNVLVHLLTTVLVCPAPAASGLFEWLKQPERRAPPPPSAPPPASEAPSLLAKEAQFEMVVADEKFLAETKHMEISPLDSCHYRVVAQLKASCEGLSEEQLAKLGVILFNCEAESVGRQTYLCTEEMTLKECTEDMDSDAWNAYHIISNRARAVCYSVRQQLFRLRAEHTVNALISTATSQLDAMADLKNGQLELKELTAASLDKLLDGHKALQTQQGKLNEGQELMESSLRGNLQRLRQEKALIASGQELVAQLIQGIVQRMENVREHLQIQGSEVHENHQSLVKDLTDVRHQAQDIYQKIDSSMLEFLRYQDQTSHYYGDLMSKLERVNATLGSMLHYIDNMQSRLEDRLHVIQGYLGWAGLSLTAMWTCIAHAGYFAAAAVLMTFLHCPAFSRAALLLGVPLNAVAAVNQQPALDLGSLSLLLLALSLAHWFVHQLWGILRTRAAPLPLAPADSLQPHQQKLSSFYSYPASSTPQKEKSDVFMEPDHLLLQDSFGSGDVGVSAGSLLNRRPKPEPWGSPTDACQPSTLRAASQAGLDDVPLRNLGGAFDAVNDDFGTLSPSGRPSSSFLNNSSFSGRQLCSGITKTGKACKKRAVPGQEYCRVHQGGHCSYLQPERAPLQSAG